MRQTSPGDFRPTCTPPGEMGAHSDQIGRQAILYICATGVQRTPWLTRECVRPRQPVGLDDEQAPALNASQSSSQTCLGYTPEAENSSKTGPHVFFILAADISAEVEAPIHLRAAAK